ncbi:UNVERIFIED_CONTAM: hypothetical protein BJ099_10374 [Lysinibacillus xylanilyticus]
MEVKNVENVEDEQVVEFVDEIERGDYVCYLSIIR